MFWGRGRRFVWGMPVKGRLVVGVTLEMDVARRIRMTKLLVSVERDWNGP